jgi:hypothetical protein
MDDRIFVVPMKGGLVRMYPTREIMPPEGALVPNDPYWTRRLLHGDVALGAAAAPALSPVTASLQTLKTKKEPPKEQ